MKSATSKISSQLKNKFKKFRQQIANLSKEKKYWFILILIVILGAGVRFYQLAQLPMGYNYDEAGMGYDAWCLANWRVSRHMMHLPVYLLNAGGGQSALYAYLTAVLIKIFGISKFILRTPAAIFGLLTIIFGSLIAKEGLGKKAGLMTALIIAVSPYFIMMSRLGFDCNLFLGMSTIALYCTIQAIKKQKYRFWIGSGLLWGLTLYSYVLSYIAIPVFLFLLIIYLLIIKKINWRQILVFGLSILILAWPLILLIVINYFNLPPIYGRFFYIPKLMIWRIKELSSVTDINIWQRLISLPRQFFTLTHGDVEAFIPDHGSFYHFAPPFIILGFFLTCWQGLKQWQKKKFSVTTIITLWMFGQLFLACSLDSIVHYQFNAFYFALIYCLVFCFFWLSRYIYKQWHQQSITIYWTAIITLYLCSFAWFCNDYFIEQPQAGFPIAHFGDTFTQPMAFLQDWFDQHHLVLEDHQIYLNEKYIYYYLGALIPPQEVNLIGDQMREVNYQNIHFEWLPGPNSPPNFVKSAIEDEDVYIIQNYNDEYIQNLLALGFSSIYQNDRYTIYVNLDGLLPVATAETEPSP